MLSYGIPGQPQWGTDVSKDAVTMINTKLDLGPRESRLDELESTWHLLEGTKGLSFAHVQECGPEPAFTHKSPTQIVTDYLTKIRECACRSENIDLKHLSTTKTPVDIVVTVPVVSNSAPRDMGRGDWLIQRTIRIGRTKPRMRLSRPSEPLDSLGRHSRPWRIRSWFLNPKQLRTLQLATVSRTVTISLRSVSPSASYILSKRFTLFTSIVVSCHLEGR